MSEFSQSELQNLWIQAGGDPGVAPLMSAIAMAESGGSSGAKNPSSGACGIWQIFPPEIGCENPFNNAQMAVRKYNTQGLGAWEAYTNGAYQSFISAVGAFGRKSQTQTGTRQNTDKQNCQTFVTLGVCWDGIVGLAATIVGITLMVAPLVIMAIRSPEGQKLINTSEQVTTTAVMVAPK